MLHEILELALSLSKISFFFSQHICALDVYDNM